MAVARELRDAIDQAQMTVRLLPEGAHAEVPAGTPLDRATQAGGVALDRPCGGLGVCGQCRVRYDSGAPEPGAADRHFLSQTALDEGWRLACQQTVEADAAIFIPDSSRGGVQQILEGGQGREVRLEPLVTKVAVTVEAASLRDERDDSARLVDALAALGLPAPTPTLALLRRLPARLRAGAGTVTAWLAGDQLLDLEAGDTTDTQLGIAIDVGSTTIVAYLLDLGTGRELAVRSTMNPQVALGDDLIARIHHAGARPGQVELNSAVLEGVNRVILDVCRAGDVRRRSIGAVVVVGNPCMLHLLLDLDVTGLGLMPYVPVVLRAVETTAVEVGLRLNPRARVAALPSIGGFVGADACAVALVHLADESAGPRLAIDIGTNGELVLQSGAERWACSAAAGPAFEGARIGHGMRGAAGAIAGVSLADGEVRYVTVDHQPPRGICGSGLLDAVAELRRAGMLGENGRLMSPSSPAVAALPAGLRERLIETDEGVAFVLAGEAESAVDHPILLAQRDLREFQLAKASIYAAAMTLLDLAGLTPADVEAVYLAGAFGSFLQIESALVTGLLPPFAPEVVRAVGNAAGSGAKLALLSRAEYQRAAALSAATRHLVLSTDPRYQEHFIEGMGFPAVAAGG